MMEQSTLAIPVAVAPRAILLNWLLVWAFVGPLSATRYSERSVPALLYWRHCRVAEVMSVFELFAHVAVVSISIPLVSCQCALKACRFTRAASPPPFWLPLAGGGF